MCPHQPHALQLTAPAVTQPAPSPATPSKGGASAWMSGGDAPAGRRVMRDDTVVTGQDGNGNKHTGVAGWSVPGYTELKALGSGGSGDVVLARHDASGTLVAVKYLRRKLLADPQWVGLFRAEAQVLAALDDPNIIRLYEYVESPAGAAIVMELVDGVSVREILAHQGATTPEAALVVLRGSLHQAHAHTTMAPGTPHLSMIPDPGLVTSVILEATRATT